MKDGPGPSPSAATAAERRRLDAIFGDVLPETTRDDRDEHDREASARADGEDAGEAWLRSQVPPHHGD